MLYYSLTYIGEKDIKAKIQKKNHKWRKDGYLGEKIRIDGKKVQNNESEKVCVERKLSFIRKTL